MVQYFFPELNYVEHSLVHQYTQISSLFDLLKQSIKARGIQRLVVPPHSNPLTKEIEIAFKMIKK